MLTPKAETTLAGLRFGQQRVMAGLAALVGFCSHCQFCQPAISGASGGAPNGSLRPPASQDYGLRARSWLERCSILVYRETSQEAVISVLPAILSITLYPAAVNRGTRFDRFVSIFAAK